MSEDVQGSMLMAGQRVELDMFDGSSLEARFLTQVDELLPWDDVMRVQDVVDAELMVARPRAELLASVAIELQYLGAARANAIVAALSQALTEGDDGEAG